jgi:hypothetical protein
VDLVILATLTFSKKKNSRQGSEPGQPLAAGPRGVGSQNKVPYDMLNKAHKGHKPNKPLSSNAFSCDLF